MKLSLKFKLIMVIGLLGAVPLLGVGLNAYDLQLSKRASEQMDITQAGAQYLSHINGLVYAAVMESRGIYMSPNWEKSEPFSKNLLHDLEEIAATANLWKSRVVESERSKIDNLAQDIDQFIAFRRELVRLAQFDTAATARAFGDNDANRKVRSALNVKLTALDQAYKGHVADAEREVKRIEELNLRIFIGLAILATVALGAGFFFLIYGLIRPLYGVRGCLLQIADGSLDIDVPDTDRRDEVGDIARAVMALRDGLLEKSQIEQRHLTELEHQHAEAQRRTTDMSQRAEAQSALLEKTSSSMEEIAAAVKQNAENARRADRITAETCEAAYRGNAVVAKTIKSISNIENSSRKIADIISVIDEISRQTNLLALNAAVEAARAGEVGRGFAVVASEVRSLAERSSQAAKDIKFLITNSQSQVQEGVELVNQAGTVLGEVVTSIKKAADVAADIAQGSTEQATGVEQISEALAQMDEVNRQSTMLIGAIDPARRLNERRLSA